MATTVNSSYQSGMYRASLDYTFTETATTYKVDVTLYVQLSSGSSEGAWNFQGCADAGGGYGSWVAGDSTYLDTTTRKKLTTRSYTWTKTHSAKSLTVRGQVKDTYLGTGPVTASKTLTANALASYAVTYNANGGTGAPSAQTKWYGEALTLSTTTPTRDNYNFRGWATSATGAVAYAAGGSYTGNAALALYAVWELAAASPAISSLSVFRSDSSGVADAESTTHFTARATWSVDAAAASASLKLSYTVPGASSATTQTVSLSGTSGTVTRTYAAALPEASSMAVTATLTDATHSLAATRSATVPTVFAPLHFSNKGLSAAFFGVARSTLSRVLRVFGRVAAVTTKAEMAYDSGDPSSAVTGDDGGLWLHDADGNWLARVNERNQADGHWMLLEKRRRVSGTDKYCGLFLGVDASGDAAVKLGGTNAKYAFHKATSAWTQLASAKSGTAMTFTLPTNCTEVMVVAVCTTTTNSIRVYAGSVVIPRALLSTTKTEWLLGGGSASGGSSTSGIRYCAVDITTTSASGVGAYADGTNRASTTTFYVYAR